MSFFCERPLMKVCVKPTSIRIDDDKLVLDKYICFWQLAAEIEKTISTQA